jgi:hypothetical protein
MKYNLDFAGIKFTNVAFPVFVLGVCVILPLYVLCLVAVIKLAWAIVFGGLLG